MKRHLVTFVILLVLGIALCATGAVFCAINSDFTTLSKVTYTEKSYETDTDINAIDLELKGNYNFIIESGESCSLDYSDSDRSTINVAESGNTLKVTESTHWTSWVYDLFSKTERTDIVLTVKEDTILSIICEIDGEIKVNLPAMEYGNIDFEVNGGATIVADGDIVAKYVELDISGYGDVNLKGAFNNLDIETSGGSTVNLQGSASSLEVDASGASTLKTENFKCDNVSIKASGSVGVTLMGEGNTLNVSASGACRIYAGEFALKTAVIRASGSVRAQINASEKITLRASGSAKIEYYGNPQIDKDVSGSAQINKIS